MKIQVFYFINIFLKFACLFIYLFLEIERVWGKENLKQALHCAVKPHMGLNPTNA